MTDALTLLQRYNPLLITLPERPLTLARPGRRGPCRVARGDYHPVSAELFLRHATLIPEAGDESLLRIGGLDRFQPARGSSGLDAIAAELAGSLSPEQTGGWYLDLTQIPSVSSAAAWSAYAAVIQRTSAEQRRAERITYARCVPAPSGGATLLQYWYLRFYADAVNNHEGDWQHATIELDAGEHPLRAGYSNHRRGLVRAWEAVRKDRDSGRPLLFVARGSHAGYFRWAERGFRPRHRRIETGLGAPVDAALTLEQRLLGRARFSLDRPPAIEPADVDWSPCSAGVVLDPALRCFPHLPGEGDEAGFWWLRFQGRWGSAHRRIRGSVGPRSPWAGLADGDAVNPWHHPQAWLDAARPDDDRQRRGPVVDLSDAPRVP